MTADIRDRLDRAGREIAQARRALAAGELLDLSLLEQLAAAIAADAAQLDPAASAALEPQTLSLLADLDALDAALRQARQAVGSQLGETGARQRAVAAYGRPPGRPSGR